MVTIPDVVNVGIMAPMFGGDLSFVSDVDRRIRAHDVGQALTNKPDAEVEEILGVAEVLLVGYPVPKALASRAPRLVWAQHTQAGVSNLLGSDLWQSSVVLTSSRGAVGTIAIAEYVLAAASHFARGLHDATLQKHAGTFARDGYEMITLRGATMGIVGLGGIGQQVARLSRAFGMRVVGTRRSVSGPLTNVAESDLVLPADQLEELAAMSDFLVICSQLTEETRGMINDRVFAAMKPSAVLINIARGEEIDEEALLAAPKPGTDPRRGAGRLRRRTRRTRPRRRSSFEHPQVLLTRHISGRGDPSSAEPVRQLFANNTPPFPRRRATRQRDRSTARLQHDDHCRLAPSA